MLELQYETWQQWPEKVKNAFDIILVDDGSSDPAVDVPRPSGLPTLSIYRVLEDRPWHQHAARNLGVHVSESDWLLLTDMDHILTGENARKLIATIRHLSQSTYYFLDRIEAITGLPTLSHSGVKKPHPNSFVMARDLYWKIGGYDEDYCGIYGTDGLFKARAANVAIKGLLPKVSLTRYSREIIPDASTVGLPRKEGRFEGDKRRVAQEKKDRGESDVVKVLQFPWERVL